MLQLKKLRDGLLPVFETHQARPDIPARLMASAYYEYSKDAKSPGTPGTPLAPALAAAHLKLRAMLTGVFAVVQPTPDQFATRMAACFSAYWMLPPVGFTGATPGLVTLAVPTPLQIAIIAIMASNTVLALARQTLPPEKVADQWATILDVWTRTVIVTHPPTPAAIGPLT